MMCIEYSRSLVGTDLNRGKPDLSPADTPCLDVHLHSTKQHGCLAHTASYTEVVQLLKASTNLPNTQHLVGQSIAPPYFKHACK